MKEAGLIKREQRDLEEQVCVCVCVHLSAGYVLFLPQIDRESGKKVAANLERITGDYQQMKKENSQLAAQLKAASRN